MKFNVVVIFWLTFYLSSFYYVIVAFILFQLLCWLGPRPFPIFAGPKQCKSGPNSGWNKGPKAAQFPFIPKPSSSPVLSPQQRSRKAQQAFCSSAQARTREAFLPRARPQGPASACTCSPSLFTPSAHAKGACSLCWASSQPVTHPLARVTVHPTCLPQTSRKRHARLQCEGWAQRQLFLCSRKPSPTSYDNISSYCAWRRREEPSSPQDRPVSRLLSAWICLRQLPLPYAAMSLSYARPTWHQQ